MANLTMNCIFNAQSVDEGNNQVGSFNANYDNGNIYYSINVMNALANQEKVIQDFNSFKKIVFEKIESLTEAGFIAENKYSQNDEEKEETEFIELPNEDNSNQISEKIEEDNNEIANIEEE